MHARAAWTKNVLAVLAFATVTVLSPAHAQRAQANAPKLDVSYEPTPQPVVDAMLRLANVGRDDFLIDLGCGDGRIPVTAAKMFGTKGLGVDLDPQRIEEARANAKKHGVVAKVKFLEADLFQTSLGEASVITLFLYYDINLKLRPRLLDLTPGTRIVSHAHDMGDWRADGRRMVMGSAIYLWVVPARIGGKWQVSADGRLIDLQINQTYQRLEGTAVVDGRSLSLRNSRLSGAQVSFDLALTGTKLRRFAGRVAPTGEIVGPDWRATR